MSPRRRPRSIARRRSSARRTERVTGIAVPAPALQLRSVPQLFDALISIARRHAWDLFTLSLLFHFPVHFFRIAGAFAGRGSAIAGWNPERHIGSPWWMLWNTLAVAACTVAACQVYEEGGTNVRRAIARMRAGGWRFLGTVVVFEVLVDGVNFVSPQDPGVVMLVFAYVAIALAYCAPVIPVALSEAAAPWTAVRRSLWLVRHNFRRVAIAVWIVWMVTSIADSSLVNLVGSLMHRDAVTAVFDLVVDAVLYPLRGIVLAVVYYDCRVRREGYDLERLMDTG